MRQPTHTMLKTSDALYRQYALQPRLLLGVQSHPGFQQHSAVAAAAAAARESVVSGRLAAASLRLQRAEKSSAATDNGMLDLEIDPKLAWALRNRNCSPSDVNTADRELLLRVPGLGKRAVDRILLARRHTTPAACRHCAPDHGIEARAAVPGHAGSPAGAPDRLRRSSGATGARGTPARPVRMARHSVAVAPGDDLPGFRDAARRLIACEAPPHEVIWSCDNAADRCSAAKLLGTHRR